MSRVMVAENSPAFAACGRVDPSTRKMRYHGVPLRKIRMKSEVQGLGARSVSRGAVAYLLQAPSV